MHGFDLAKDVAANGSVRLTSARISRGSTRSSSRAPTCRLPSSGSSREPHQKGRPGLSSGNRRRSCVPAPAAAHGLTGRADLPIPEWLFAWAAAVVLIVSFVGLALLWRSPQLEKDNAFRPLPRELSGSSSTRGRRRSPRSLGSGSCRDGVERPRRRPVAPGELRADVHLRRLLGRARRGQHRLRRRVPRLQPLARDRARHGLRHPGSASA